MKHRKYEKIHRLGKDEVEGILEGYCYIQEKVDGANASIWLDDGVIKCGSRSRDVSAEQFNGLPAWVYAHEGIRRFFDTYGEEFTLYGEWLVRHTISYNELSYKKFYLYDVYSNNDNLYIPIDMVYSMAKEFDIPVVPLRLEKDNPTLEEISAFIGMTDFGDRGEGIVIKNHGFKNKFGDMVYAKMVTESFKEDNGIAFGGNNKHSDTYWEIYVMNKYITLERVRKVMQKLESKIDSKWDMKHIPMVMGATYHDMIQEEAWDIQKKVPKLDFKALERICYKKIKAIFIEIINDDISVAHANH